ncbi:TniB family NTP-binding protein [Jannaschia marina]|uniref:TniB family NTP-binding protein n=1 Tax=Jannaschia marina TaxID=2741674 RepID=UPI0015CD5321|nr:TniB family NTP-binding protein [Jannaschia marina]
MTMSEPDENREWDVELLIARLRSTFISNDAFENLSTLFDRHMKRRRAADAMGLTREAGGIVVVGASGSGKTTAVARLLERYPDLARPERGVELAEVVCLQVPSPATLKHVGAAMLQALGYPLTRDRPAPFIWDQVRHLLQQRGTLFVHLDEAQDLYMKKSLAARSDVVNTLKSLMNNKAWPVGLILSGTPELMELVNSDPQLARRVDIAKLDAVSWEADASNVGAILNEFRRRAGLRADEDVRGDDFTRRLVHAGANEFGRIVETMVSGLEEALIAGDTTVGRHHFATAFRRKADCIPAFNPFLADDFRSIDTRRFGQSDAAADASTGQ